MIAIKIGILQRMDSAPIAVKICCIKFLQKVVQVQTPGVIADPRVRCSYTGKGIILTGATATRPE